MTPEQLQQLEELYRWMQQMKETFRPIRGGTSALTQTYTDSHGDTVTAPKAYAGSEVVSINGRPREIPFI